MISPDDAPVRTVCLAVVASTRGRHYDLLTKDIVVAHGRSRDRWRNQRRVEIARRWIACVQPLPEALPPC